MQIDFTPDGRIKADMTPDELTMLMIMVTNNISPSSILEKSDDLANDGTTKSDAGSGDSIGQAAGIVA